MATTPDDPPPSESDATKCVQPHKRCTWLPVLGGVLCGMIALCLLSTHEPSFFYRLTAWAINETPPVKMIEPRTVHFTLFMLTLAAVGGSNVHLSEASFDQLPTVLLDGNCTRNATDLGHIRGRSRFRLVPCCGFLPCCHAHLLHYLLSES